MSNETEELFVGLLASGTDRLRIVSSAEARIIALASVSSSTISGDRHRWGLESLPSMDSAKQHTINWPLYNRGEQIENYKGGRAFNAKLSYRRKPVNPLKYEQSGLPAPLLCGSASSTALFQPPTLAACARRWEEGALLSAFRSLTNIISRTNIRI
jgi:hypothetical protein